MAITGAIFDCDGTLLDSMPLWRSCCIELLERHGVANAAEVFERTESLDMYDKCVWYHKRAGAGESGEALYRELWERMERAYEHRVRPFAGARAFLEQLRERGIPCVVLSSTPSRLVRYALTRHGLADFFSRILLVGDLGTNKSDPACYRAARALLGTPSESTWVFEDAPFAVRSAVRAGLPCAALLNDHDGRDESFLRRWATYASDGWQGLVAEDLQSRAPRTLEAVVVAGSPEPSPQELVASLCSQGSFVVAADAGLDVLWAAGRLPDLCVGDFDSVSDKALAWARKANVPFERHPVEKDDTDLGLALSCVRREADARAAAAHLTLTCASGGRADHFLGVWGVLARNADLCPRLVENGFTCRILSREGQRTWELNARTGAAVSVVALAAGTRATEHGMRWELADEPLELLGDRGVSNCVVDERARVRCEAGCLAVFLFANNGQA